LAVKLRLTRRGKKKQPFYRIVAADSRTARDGKYLEKIGLYNPLPDPAEVLIDEEKAFYWLNQGAVPSDTVKNLLSKKGIILKWSLKKKGLDETKVEEEFRKWETIQLEEQKKKEALEAQLLREDEEKKAAEEKDKKEETPAAVEEPAAEKVEPVEIEDKVEEKPEATETEEKVEVKENVEPVSEQEVTETKVDNNETGDEQPVVEDVDAKSEENISTSEDETKKKEDS